MVTVTHDAAHTDISEMFGKEYWDERYGSTDQVWSGNPNGQLVKEVSGLAPGTALDAGSGEGTDAIWLGGRGWDVTAADFSAAGLSRAARQATKAGVRINWLQRDLRDWEPDQGAYDLVTAQYLHFPRPLRDTVFRRLAGAVAVGGTLLIVGHHTVDLDTSLHRPPMPELFYTADEIATLLEPQEWDVVTKTSAGRTVPDQDGNEVTSHDAVLRAVRRS